MGFFKRANVEEVVRVETPDGEDWIELAAELSKSQVNRIILAAPKDDEDRKGAMSFNDNMIALVVRRWSFTEEDGTAVPFSLEEFNNLTAPAATWITTEVAEQFRKLTGAEVEAVEKAAFRVGEETS